MTKEFDDYYSSFRSKEQLEVFAAAKRRELGLDSYGCVPAVLGVLQMAAAKLKECPGLRVEPRPAQMMGRAQAFARTEPGSAPVIVITQQLMEEARKDAPEARFVLFHEWFHLLLHPGPRKFRIATGNITLSFIQSPHHSAEWQADQTTRAFLMPREAVLRTASDRELADGWKVPLEQAKLRREDFATGQKLSAEEIRQIIGVRHEKQRRATDTLAERVQKVEKLKLELWAKLKTIQGEDEALFREARGWRVAWNEYLKMTQCGWKIEGNEIRAYLDLLT